MWAIKIPEGRAEGLRFMRHMREPLRTFHQPLLVVAYSHMAESFAGVVLRCWGFKHRACGDTGVTYWLRGGAEGAPDAPRVRTRDAASPRGGWARGRARVPRRLADVRGDRRRIFPRGGATRERGREEKVAFQDA